MNTHDISLKGKKVLVTGAGGFIASHLVERLVKEECRVLALIHYDSRPHRGNLEFLDKSIQANLEIRSGDIQDAHFVNHVVAGCDVVFHLAALIAIPHSYRAPGSYLTTNVEGTLNVLQACMANNVCRLVHK